MPWKVYPVSEQRLAFVHLVDGLGHPVAAACREFGISRKTAYKWLNRSRGDPGADLADRSRRPRRSPRRTGEGLEQRILHLRDSSGWGARKIRSFLERRHHRVPSITTVHNVLRRHDRIHPPAQAHPPPQSFERRGPNELWQLDFKGPVEVARRRRHPLTVIDDHSRYLLVLQLCNDHTFRTTWQWLWEAFGEFGLPESLLSDNAFGTTHQHPKTLSQFDCKLVRLGIRPLHGRPHHPQTQGKVERLNGTIQRELYPRARTDRLEHFEADADRWRRVYNNLRPHEALGDQPPLSRWRPSPRPRPDELPPVEYPPGSVLRKVSKVGDINYRGYRILAGYGLIGQDVRIEERDDALVLYYSWKRIRVVPVDRLQRGIML
jgi:transposase InsO family protein